jgi:hypothetical protein
MCLLADWCGPRVKAAAFWANVHCVPWQVTGAPLHRKVGGRVGDAAHIRVEVSAGVEHSFDEMFK